MPQPSFADAGSRLAHRLLPRSLAWRVYLLFAASLLLFVGLSLGAFYRHQFSQQVEDVYQSAQHVSEILAHTLADSAVIGDYDNIRKTLDKAVYRSNFASAAFIDLQGAMVQASQTPKVPIPPPAWLQAQVEQHLFDLNQNLGVGGRDYGVLRLRFASAQVAGQLWQSALIAMGLAVTSLILGLVLIRVVLRRWLGALQVLDRFDASDAQAPRSEDLPEEFRGTLGVLNRTAASLQDQLQRQASALKTLRLTLESLTSPSDATTDTSTDDIETTSRLLSELVRAREADRRALDHQKFALDQHAIVSISNRAGLIEYANDRLCQITGLERNTLLGTRLVDLLAAPRNPALLRKIYQCLGAGQVWKGELHECAQDGRHFWTSATIVPLLDGQGQAQQFITIQTDISDLKEAEVALQQAKNVAEAANRAKSEFLANMSHEIRTPMNGILGMTDLALETPLNPEQREYLNIVRSSSESLLTILNDILDFSKIEAGHLDMEVLNFSLRENLTDAMDLLAFKAQDKGLELLSWVAPEVPDLLVGDPGRLRQIVTNLVGNAVKFTAQGEIKLSVALAQREGQRVRLRFEVQDTGLGIPADKMDRLFKPFSQVDASTTRQYGGTGLGLTISKRLAELMNGDMGVHSVSGQGSTFWFTCELAVAGGNVLAPEPQVLIGRRVLVVDDNQSNLRLMQLLLQRWGAQVDLQDNPLATLPQLQAAQAEGRPFALVILDMQMPGQDGLSLGAALQTAMADWQERPPLVLLTSMTRREDPGRLAAAGITLTLSKPVRERLLLQNLQALLLQPAAPASQPTAARAAPVAQAPAPSTWHQARLLLVEDNAINRQLALRLLGKLGHEVHTAHHGLEALEALARDHYDLVLMDCQMPEMDGYTATRRIRALDSAVLDHDIPVIALTANAMKGDREKVLAAGMNDYLTKPIQMAELTRALDQWLQGRTQPPSTSPAPSGSATNP